MLTSDQANALGKIKDWYASGSLQYFCLGGLAGTGKTTLLGHLQAALPDSKIVFCSPTNKARLVLQEKLGPEATTMTVHSLIYKPYEIEKEVRDEEGNITYEKEVKFSRREDPSELGSLIVVDEASMVDGDMSNDLGWFKTPILYVGDSGQLPPVKSSDRIMDYPDITLSTIVRQAQDSPIIQLAHRVRNGEKISKAHYGDDVVVDSINSFQFDFNYWDSDSVALVATNYLRVNLNRSIRKNVFGFVDDHPQVGDRVISLRNRLDAGVYNGMLATIQEIRKNDYGIIYMTVLPDGEQHPIQTEAYADQFNNEEKLPISYKDTRDLWDFGYAITVHKAQGSEWRNVVVLDIQNSWADRKRWLYTAITRSKERLTILQ